MTRFEDLWAVFLLFPTMRPEAVPSIDAEVKADLAKKNKENK